MGRNQRHRRVQGADRRSRAHRPGPWLAGLLQARKVRVRSHRLSADAGELRLRLLGAYANLFDALEKQNEQLSDEPPEAVRALLDEEVIDGVRCWALGAIGQIYLESYRQRFPPQRCLPRAASPDERRRPSFADHHYPAGFKDAVKRIFEEVPFVTGGHSLPYSKQTGIARRGFYFEDGGNEREKGIVFEMREKDFGARYLFFTTAANRSEWIAAAVELNRRFGERS
jgi:hypothetical protein